MKTIYYALMLFCALLTVIVTAFTIQAAVNGHPIAYVLVPIIAVGAWVMYDDSMSIIQEITE